MKVKNEFVEINIGEKKYILQNLILNELLKRYAKSQIEVGNIYHIYDRPYLQYLLLKFDTPFENLNPSSELHNADFDVGIIWGNSNVNSLSEKQATIQYQYPLNRQDSFYLYGTGTVTGDNWSQFEGRQITALGFNSWFADDTNVINKYPVCAVLDTSNYNIYLESNQDFVVTRKDIITTDANFYSNNSSKIQGPVHLCPYGTLLNLNTKTPSQSVLYSVGLSSYPDYIDREFIIGEDINAVQQNNEINITGLGNYISTDNPFFVNNNLLVNDNLFPMQENYKYWIFKYKLWDRITNQNDEIEYIDTGYFYYQSIPINQYGNTNLKISYERG